MSADARTIAQLESTGFSHIEARCPCGDGFEILVDGARRTFRDVENIALAAAHHLKRANLKSEITIVNTKSGEWAIVSDIVSDEIVWHPAPGR